MIEAIMVISQGKGRYSSHILCQSILKFFTVEGLFPKGMCSQMECVERWALRMGQALQRLASWSQLRAIIYHILQFSPKRLIFMVIFTLSKQCVYKRVQVCVYIYINNPNHPFCIYIYISTYYPIPSFYVYIYIYIFIYRSSM